MVARNYTAVTTLRIMDGVRLPKGSTAELRSATPLGDVFVAVKPPASASAGAPLLKNGDTIGLDATTAAATVESVLSSAAILVNGGAVRNFTNIINGLGKATGDQGQAFGDLIRKTNTTLARLNSRSDQLSTAMTETSRLADRFDAKNQTLSRRAGEPQARRPTRWPHTPTQIADLVRAGRRHHRPASQVPVDRGHRHQRAQRHRRRQQDRAARGTTWCLTPDATLYSLNRLMPPFVKSTTSNAIAVRASVDRLVLGSIPDIGFTGDLGLHGPKRYNWHQLVGSFQYTLCAAAGADRRQGPGGTAGTGDPEPDRAGCDRCRCPLPVPRRFQPPEPPR